jgi:hypothetical protein
MKGKINLFLCGQKRLNVAENKSCEENNGRFCTKNNRIQAQLSRSHAEKQLWRIILKHILGKFVIKSSKWIALLRSYAHGSTFVLF